MVELLNKSGLRPLSFGRSQFDQAYECPICSPLFCSGWLTTQQVLGVVASGSRSDLE